MPARPDPAADAPGIAGSEVTDGHLLDGRVRYRQPRHGFRSGIEPVLLAASIPARAGERVLEGGTGAGAALLCLAARVPGLTGTGIERDPAMAALARHNAHANEAGELRIVIGDIEACVPEGPFDHGFANPPYHLDRGTAPPDPARQAAKRAPDGLLGHWAARLGAGLRRGGTLTMILPAACLPQALDGFRRAGCPPSAVLPLWPRTGQAAKLILVRGIRDGRRALRLLPGLVLHPALGTGGFTAEAERVLRHASPLPMA